MSVSTGRNHESLNSDIFNKRKKVPTGRLRNTSAESFEENDEEFYLLISELRVELELRKNEEERLMKEISDVVFINYSGGENSRAFGKAVSKLNNHLVVAENGAKQLAASLSTISRLADNISDKVCALDVAKNRVVECLQLAGDMRDLGVCSEGIDEAIRHNDFEQAAQYIHRFLTLDKAVFQVKDSKDAGQSVLQSYDVLKTAATRLHGILEQRMDSAVESENFDEVLRFAKLFPLVSQHDCGLKRLSIYLNGQISKNGEDTIKVMNAGGSDDSRAIVLFSDTLFIFLSGVADIVNSCRQLVHGYYGINKMVDFLELLQHTIDVTVDTIFTTFVKKRHINTIIKTIQWQQRDSKGFKLDPLELDVLLNEVCFMICHAERYFNFVRQMVVSDNSSPYVEQNNDERRKVLLEHKATDSTFKLEQMLNRSIVGTTIQSLSGHYVMLEQRYMEESFNKALAMEIRDEGLMSSLVDDILFLVRKCVRRAISSSSVDCICSTLNNCCTLLETTFVRHLEGAIQAGYPSGGFAAEALQTAHAAYSVIQHGKSGETGTEGLRELFLTAANNARGSSELIAKLTLSLKSECMRDKNARDTGKLEHSLSQLDEVHIMLANVAKMAMESLCSSALVPRIKNNCEAYVDLPHELSESQFNEQEAMDPFIEQFTANLDKMLATFDKALQAENYQQLILIVCGEVGRQMERVVMKCKFNRLGALQLDREMRHLFGYLSGIAGWAARERIQRLSQVVSILNVDSIEEARELWEAGRGSSARELSSNFVRKVLNLRSDFPAAIVDRFQL